MDILLAYSGQVADLRIKGRDIMGDDSLYTAVLVSLFTDARASHADELPPELAQEADLRGYWGDAIADDKQTIGSKLWLLHREKQLPRVLARAEQYATEALEWLLRDGLATAVQVIASNDSQGTLSLAVSVTLPTVQGLKLSTKQWNFTFPPQEAA